MKTADIVQLPKIICEECHKLEKLYKYEQNSIPIQKIKDKIKKNKNLVEEYLKLTKKLNMGGINERGRKRTSFGRVE